MFILVNLILSAANSVLGELPNIGALTRATLMKAALANCKVRLCQNGFVFSATTALADAIANEADYDGYTAGGNTIATWGNALAAPGGGFAIAAETTFAYVDGMTHTANAIRSGWIETADGDLVTAFNLAAPVNFAVNGDGFVLQFLDTTTG